MAFVPSRRSFGADDGSFDWGSLLNSVVTTAGQVTTAAINAGNAPSGYPAAGVIPAGFTYNPATGHYTNALGQIYTPPNLTSTAGSSTLLLLGLAGVLAFVLFRKKGRR
jgi:hypothetical protein